MYFTDQSLRVSAARPILPRFRNQALYRVECIIKCAVHKIDQFPNKSVVLPWSVWLRWLKRCPVHRRVAGIRSGRIPRLKKKRGAVVRW